MTMHDPPVRRAVGRSSKTPRIFTIFDLDQFLLATKDTQNQEVVRTLKLMNANHNRQAKDLQRRVAKATAALAAVAAAEAAAAATSLTNQQKLSSRNRLDGNVPQNSVDSPTSSAPSSRRRGPSSLQEQGNSGGLGQRRHNVPSQQSLGILGQESRPSGGGGPVGGDTTGSGGSYLGSSSEASSNSSSAIIEESFTLIKNHVVWLLTTV